MQVYHGTQQFIGWGELRFRIIWKYYLDRLLPLETRLFIAYYTEFNLRLIPLCMRYADETYKGNRVP